MFEDSLFATNQHRTPQRGLAAVMSFGVQAVFLGLLVLIPLFYTDALPLTSLKSYVEIPVPPGPRQPPPPTEQSHRPPVQQTSEMQGAILLQPPRIPDRVADIRESATPPPVGPYIQDSTGPGGVDPRSSLFRDVLASNMHPVAPQPMHIQTKPTRVSGGVIAGFLINKVTPVYPKMAILTRQQGQVLLHAIIGRNGTIQNLQAISGPPLLIPAALDAVQRWRYRPYLLNNEPVEVETQITVNFTLGG